MSRYRETLHAWAARYVPDGAKVTSVTVEQDPGYRYSSYTYEDPHIDVTVRYELADDFGFAYPDVENLGEILTQLFAIEDAQ